MTPTQEDERRARERAARVQAHEFLGLGPDCMNHWVGDHAACNDLTAALAAHEGELEALRAERDDWEARTTWWFSRARALKAFVEDQRDAGGRFDTMPSYMLNRADGEDGIHRFYCGYLRRVDQGVRERARAILDKLAAESDALRDGDLMPRLHADFAEARATVTRCEHALNLASDEFKRLKRIASKPMKSWDSGLVVGAQEVDDVADDGLAAIARAFLASVQTPEKPAPVTPPKEGR